MMAGTVRRSPPKLPTVRLLLQDVAAGIRILRTRDGLDVSDEQVLERARNIVTGLVGNYRIASLDPVTGQTSGPTTGPTTTQRTARRRPIVQLDLLAALDRTAAQIAKDQATDA